MGLFGSKETCGICKKEDGKIKLKNGYVCKTCIKSCGGFISNKVDLKDRMKKEIENAIEKNKLNEEKIKGFIGTKKIGRYIEVDENNKSWTLLESLVNKRESKIIYNFNDIKTFELIEDGEIICKGGIGQAPIKEIVGNKSRTFINRIIIKIYFKDNIYPEIEIPILDTELNINSKIYTYTYSNIKEIINFLEETQNVSEEALLEVDDYDISVVDRLIKLDNLFEANEISEIEYEKRKSELLGF